MGSGHRLRLRVLRSPTDNWTWQLGELFRVGRIEAVFIRGPYGIQSGWSTYQQGRSEQIQDVR
jgi:hypothetical protein